MCKRCILRSNLTSYLCSEFYGHDWLQTCRYKNGNRLNHSCRKTRFKNITNAHINRFGLQQHEHATGRANGRNMWHPTMLGVVGQQCVRLHGAIWVRNVLISLWLSNLIRTELTGRSLTFILFSYCLIKLPSLFCTPESQPYNSLCFPFSDHIRGSNLGREYPCAGTQKGNWRITSRSWPFQEWSTPIFS